MNNTLSEKTLRYNDKGNVHMDFHGATNTTIDFIIKKYGIETMNDMFKKVGDDVYADIKKHIKSGNVELINKKVEDVEGIEAEIKGYDICFHLAAGVGVQYIMENVSSSLLTNIEATHKMIGACSKNQIPLLLTSTSEVYGV